MAATPGTTHSYLLREKREETNSGRVHTIAEVKICNFPKVSDFCNFLKNNNARMTKNMGSIKRINVHPSIGGGGGGGGV